MKLLCLALLVFAACPSAPEPAPDRGVDPTPDATEPALTPKGGALRPDVRHERFDNGLDVYLVRDTAAPLVNVQVWVRAGSRDEREAARGEDHGTTGLSHFFEHLMFQGTARFPSYDDALVAIGAQNNAFTYQDATVFWAYAPKQHLRLVLDIEADRFQHMKVDFLHVEPEREVVKNERRQRLDGSPSALAEERATRNAFDHRPYRWGAIGWMSDLDSITLEEAQAYHAAHYHPGGAFLVIAGDFDTDATLGWIRELWGVIPPHAGAPARRDLPDEVWKGPRTDHVIEDSATVSVAWAFRAPAPGGATLRDYAALEIIDYVLTAGKSARLQRRLVFSDTPRVSELGASLMELGDPWLYEWEADLLPDATVGGVEAIIDAEMKAIAKDGVTADELQRAVAGLRTDVVHGLLSNSDRADGIGWSLAATGDPFARFARLEAYATITQEELRATAARYLIPEARSRVTVVSPTRLVALVAAWTKDRPSPLAPTLTGATTYFVAYQQHQKNVAEADREERAIARLAQRADFAKAKDRAAARAIDKYLSENESGVSPRRVRLKKTRSALAATGKTLEARRAELERQADDIAKRSKSPLNVPHKTVIDLLLAKPEHGIGIPLPPRGGGGDEPTLAVQTVAAWVLEQRGLHKTAQSARSYVLREGVLLHNGMPSELVRRAYELCYDTSIENLPLVDVPSFAVRPTGGPR